MWVRCKKRTLRLMGLAAAHQSWLVFQAEDRSPDKSSCMYAYHGDRLRCGIVGGAYFVGSARVHVVNLAQSLVPGRKQWYCDVVVVSEFPVAMGNLMLVDSISFDDTGCAAMTLQSEAAQGATKRAHHRKPCGLSVTGPVKKILGNQQQILPLSGDAHYILEY